ncbi:MAG: hypothetical protein VCA74_02085 [Deltaproteobacteria bacterium]
MGLPLTLALLAALGFSAYRLLRRQRLKKVLAALPGASVANAIKVDSFDAIDSEVGRSRCLCGGRYDRRGEGSAGRGGVRIRFINLECRFCERQRRVYFDVSAMYH